MEYKMGSWAIAVHGGAAVGPILPRLSQEEAKQLLTSRLEIGITALQSNLPAIDVVELVVKELETLPLFNSGRGSALTAKGTVEMEASIMDGPSRRCGAVSGVTTVKNPVSLARLVMENSPYSHLAFSGAEEFARLQGVEMVKNDCFITEENVGNPILFDYRIPTGSRTAGATATDSPLQMNGLPISIYLPKTFGCVVVDSQGQCAAATSTGGLMNRMTGRIGCTPTIGAGTYACDLCGVSCTGEDEAIIRGTLAREVASVMEYKGLNLQQAMDFAMEERLDQGFAGLIAVSKNGEVACGFNRKGTFRGGWHGVWATGISPCRPESGIRHYGGGYTGLNSPFCGCPI